MNLATSSPWIPVTDTFGCATHVSLLDLFTNGANYRDLAVRPHERIALMRLFLAIAQAALNGPAESRELGTALKRLPAAAVAYLEAHQAEFELFDSQRPFLQFAGLSKEESTPVSKLDFALATGNNTTLFDHPAASEEGRVFPPAQLALMLITFQCFSPGGRIGVGRWQGAETPGKGSSGHAPCAPSAMLHTFVWRDDLLSTIAANLLTKHTVAHSYRQPWGQPVWEKMPGSFKDVAASENATHTYLGRLMPLARAILLSPDGQTVLLANGLDYPTPPAFPHEPTATLVKKRDDSGYALVGPGQKGLWRELPALLVKRLAADGVGGPLVFNELNTEAGFDLWVGALITDKASILDTVEGRYLIPSQMFAETGRRLYEAEIQESDQLAWRVNEAAKKYRKALELNPQNYPESALALRRYWTAVEQASPLLRESLREALGSPEAEALLTQWRGARWRAACDALVSSCPSQTPRQHRAAALALRSLQTLPKAPAPAGSAKPKATRKAKVTA